EVVALPGRRAAPATVPPVRVPAPRGLGHDHDRGEAGGEVEEVPLLRVRPRVVGVAMPVQEPQHGEPPVAVVAVRKEHVDAQRALDAKAMELSSQDAELRAALFRLVDVTPACRSLDDLARHLTAYMEDVEERRQPLRAAMRMAETAPGRRALGAAAAAGVRHMAHRFIVAPSPR